MNNWQENLNFIAKVLDEKDKEIEHLKNELERERMRLIACGIAALGYFADCHEDYKSAPLDDVLKLVEKLKKAEAIGNSPYV